VFEMLAGQVFGTALRKMIGAFEDRAAVLYGASSASGAVSSSDGSSSSSAHNAA
jgi:coenzyme Q-binding protein COQ10